MISDDYTLEEFKDYIKKCSQDGTKLVDFDLYNFNSPNSMEFHLIGDSPGHILENSNETSIIVDENCSRLNISYKGYYKDIGDLSDNKYEDLSSVGYCEAKMKFNIGNESDLDVHFDDIIVNTEEQ